MEFWYHMFGSGMGSLHLEISDGGGWTELWSLSGDQGDEWHGGAVDLSPYSGSRTLRFRMVTGSSFRSDAALDDIRITSHEGKGLIPVGSGTPFYTTSENPQDPGDVVSLQNMQAGDTSTQTWEVKATGEAGSSWVFYTIYTSALDGIRTSRTGEVTVTIVPPSTVDAHSSPQGDRVLPDWNDTEPEKMSVLKFRVTDHGEDALDTLIDELVVSVGGTAGQAANDIAWAELNRDGVGQVATAWSITNSEIVFGATPNSDSTAQLDTVAENTYAEYTVNIYFNPSLLGLHDETYTFDIDETDVGVDLGGNSSLMAGDTEAVTPVVGTIFISEIGVTVTPDAWNIGPQPLSYVGESGTFTVENTGSAAEDITIFGSNGSNGWTLAGTVGLNAFKVEVDKDDDGSYETVLSTGEQAFATNVPVLGTETLGLKYSAPSSDTLGGGVAHDFTVTVKASVHVE